MGASTHKTYKSQQSNSPPSPVSPLESNGENWKHPPTAKPQSKGQGTISKVPLEEARSKRRLSRPFEQPFPMSTSGQRRVAPGKKQANMKRADSYVGQTSARVPIRKPAPPTLAIPAPTHQARYQPEGSQTFAERSERSARHQGWNPLKEQRLEHTGNTNKKDGRRVNGHSHDLERQDEPWPYSKPRREKRAKDPEGRVCFFFLIFMAILIIIATTVTIKFKLG